MNSTVPRFFNLLFRVQRLILNITQEKKDLFLVYFTTLLFKSYLVLTETCQKNYRTVALILGNIISHPSDCGLFGIVCSNEKKTIISNDIEPKQDSINRSHFIQFIPLILR